MGNNKQNAHIHLRVALLIARNSASNFFVLYVQFVEKSIKQPAHCFLGLARLDPQLDS